ncbi:IucA/IucC family C-terminal-domain containing protein [Peribacillus acanthi]|uniref:IucA/IucC family C-terminal-domain containing protein n=1 Tax=Peribacillus acanthi TaxID=2171554 RepID=UPI000D3E7976|nr:IucA/IucC family C-terminal-domain containing protein [Peribacillus acanthi]
MMLSEQELTLLVKLRLSIAASSLNEESRLSSKALTDSIDQSLELIKEKIGTDEDKVAASLLIKRYAFLPVIGLVMMSAFNKKLDYSLENVSLLDYTESGLWLPQFTFDTMEVKDLSKNREEWRRLILSELFNQHIYKVMNVLSKRTKISKLILWENVAVYLFWIYDMLQDLYKDSPIKERITDDFLFILSDEAALLYGNYHSNPIKRYYYEKTKVHIDEEPIRIRMTCCLSNRLPNKASCKTCPQICKTQLKNSLN